MPKPQSRRNPRESTRSHKRRVHQVARWTGAILIFVALLPVPLIALILLSEQVPAPYLAGYLGTVSVITFLIYRSDKKKARDGEWRIPETTLHFFEMIGGWPGAFIAQRLLRHKTIKVSYQIVFWLIIGLHQLAAFDSIQQWKWLKAIVSLAGELQ